MGHFRASRLKVKMKIYLFDENHSLEIPKYKKPAKNIKRVTNIFALNRSFVLIFKFWILYSSYFICGKLAYFRNLKIMRRTTGAKGCYFLAGFLQVSNMFVKHLVKVSNKFLTSLHEVSNKTFNKLHTSLQTAKP